jgi:hypothetical protein
MRYGSSVEGIKVCQMAGRSMGKYDNEKRESLETRYVESLLVVYVLCMSLLSLIDAV